VLPILVVAIESLANPEDGNLEPVMVTATTVPVSDQNRSATRSDADTMAQPQSISKVSAEQLKQQGVQTLNEAVANISGVSDPGTSGNLTIRGFEAGIMKNGTLNATSLSTFAPPLIGISRIEVLKGPEAILAGQSAGFGGVVNVITKAPQALRTAEGRLQFGTNGRTELGLDTGGALSEDKRFMGRLIASGNIEGKDKLDYEGNWGSYIAPSLGFRDRASGTEVVLAFERNEQTQKNFWSVYFDPATQNLDQSLKPLRLGENGKRLFDFTETNLSLYLNQQLTDRWRVSFKVLQQHLDQTLAGGRLGLVIAYPKTLGLDLEGSNKARKDAFKFDLNGDFDTGPINHKLLLAYDNERSSLRKSQASPFKRGLFDATNGDLIAPLANTGPQRVILDQTPRETGLLLMDSLSWGKWVVQAGVRHINYAPGEKLSDGSKKYQANLPSFGVVYRQSENSSLYANLVRSFLSNAGKTEFQTQQQVKPEQAQQMELGYKQLFLMGELALTAALYRIEQENYAAVDTAHSVYPIQYYTNVAGVTSRGLDLELSGHLTDHVSIRAAYNFGDIDYPKDVPPIPFAQQSYKLFVRYAFGSNQLGTWLGGGFQGRDAAKNQNVAGSPRSLQFDLHGGYMARDWSLQAGIKNLTDRQNYTLESGPNGVGFIVQPREVYLAAQLRF
jgi:iron complex outermembrane receptor protein